VAPTVPADETRGARVTRAGAGSVAWRVNGERLAVFGWGRAILLQLAHPLVASGVSVHSGFEGTPQPAVARFRATLRAMLSLTFAGEREAQATAAAIRRVHDRVHGAVPASMGRHAGAAYDAHDPALLAWVNLTLLDSVPLVFSRFVAPLSDDDLGQYARETRWAAELIGVRHDDLPDSAAAVRAGVDRWLRGGALEVTDEARRLARAVVHPSGLWLAGPLGRIHQLSAVGWLPEPLREAYGFRWTRADDAALEAWGRRLRTWSGRAPRWARRWAAARRAERAACEHA
jgi:uncharacterized protein (DUF2236 family)